MASKIRQYQKRWQNSVNKRLKTDHTRQKAGGYGGLATCYAKLIDEKEYHIIITMNKLFGFKDWFIKNKFIAILAGATERNRDGPD